ncbi:flagellin [Frateuria aurantia]|uniref:Flagellin n=1 Tax=Frateuria aurantia (strain ATCC 33424 / DSM 6220 / KCTC 2777 / LMG 1558 / NBRC 3245 / NCIMB 13370) TaxID=767434 RepID=H8L3D3_FRAAD|nr:flagellin [Frateuria aurantia]AFC86455.1 flagellin/flagellar hook associated protein [Frateuria aurantia DSM 6220]
MALVINTNVSSLTAQSNLNKTQSMLSKATEALSSGLKINSAADDAAGYAISQRFTTQIGGLNQANSNASDAISLAQTAESALSQITSNLQAVRDLAVQSANGTYTSSDRSAINTTVQQYLSEVTRIANQTSFNGQNVLNGSTSDITFQVGANVGQTITVDLGSGVRADQLGGNVAEASTNSLASAFTNATGGTSTVDMSKISIDGVALSGTASSAQDVVDAINSTDFTATAANSGTLPSGATISASLNASGGIDIFQSGGGTVDVKDTGSLDTNSLAAGATSGTGGTITAGTTLSVLGDGSATAEVSGAASGSLSGGNVLTVSSANELIARIDQALSTVSTFSSNLGAIQNRFQSTISTLTAQSDNLTSAQSTIQDANFASETADLSKANVLQQAGISVLATANSQPQQILKLLQ